MFLYQACLRLEIDWCGFFEANTNISEIFESCFLLPYQNYDVFYALPIFKTLEIRIYNLEFF